MKSKNEMKDVVLRPGDCYYLTLNGNKGEKIFASEDRVRYVDARLMRYFKPIASIYAVVIAESFVEMVIHFNDELSIVDWARKASVKRKEVTEHMQELARNAKVGEERTVALELISLSLRRLGTGIAMSYNWKTDNDGHVLERVPKREQLLGEDEIKAAIVQVHRSCDYCMERVGASSLGIYGGRNEGRHDIKDLIKVYYGEDKGSIRWHLILWDTIQETAEALTHHVSTIKHPQTYVLRQKNCLPACSFAKNLFEEAFPAYPSLAGFAAIVLFCNLY